MIIDFTSYINSPYFLFVLVSILCITKIILLVTLIINHIKKNSIAHVTFLLLIAIIFGATLSDATWCIKLVRNLFFPNISYAIILFFIRLSWAFLILEYQSLALLIKYLAYKKYKMNLLNKILCTTSLAFFSYFFIAAFINFGNMSEQTRATLIQQDSWFSAGVEISLMRFCVLYLFYLVGVHGIGAVIPLMYRNHLPKILYKQVSLLFYYLLIPYLIIEIISNMSYNIASIAALGPLTVIISSTFLTAALYYCTRRIMGLRFLNGSGQVELIKRFNFVDNFKQVLEQLGSATSLHELTHISQSLCKTALSIAPSNVSLHVRSSSKPLDMHKKATAPQPIETVVEEFLSTHNSTICEFISHHKILVYDELTFSNFYQESHVCQTIISFLQKINADIFLPIFDKNKLIAYLIISRNSRPEQLYSKVEQDELIVFGRYLSNIIYLIQTCNVDTLLAHEKQLSQELYKKEQELNNYKESIHSFLKYTKHKDIGILFYKNRRFTFANQTAKELIKINPNSLEGHVITKALRYLTAQVQEYRVPKTELINDYEGRKLIFTAVPNLENNSIIITVCYPDIGDLISRKITSLKNPAQWDLLLHLETTKPGTLINRWIPGSGETFLEYKINFLQQSNTLTPITLVIPSADALTAAELIHLIGNRHGFEHIILNTAGDKNTAKNYTPDQFIQMLENYAPTSTLFIENIEHLEHECQHILADVFHHGYCYHPKTTLKVTPGCRIICSTTLALEDLTQQGLITPALSAQLRNTLLIMPPLSTLPFSEFDDLIMALCHQKIKVGALNSLLELSIKDKERIMAIAPASIAQLKHLIQDRLDHKSHDALDTAFEDKDIQDINNPIIMHAGRLGKNALRDKQVMVELWKLFKNQNKIAAFLGVNRSSVNRRCKEYQLL